MAPKKDDVDMYKLICKDRFDKHDKAFERVEGHLTNHIPHKIDNMFWKMLGAMLIFAGIIVAVIKLI